VFSHQVGSLMKRIAKWDNYAFYYLLQFNFNIYFFLQNKWTTLDKDVSQTADFILFMDTLFDNLNGVSDHPHSFLLNSNSADGDL
jgi:hypothetical protein